MPTDQFEEFVGATNWSRTTHAYGPAEDLPELLQTLAVGGTRERKQAFSALYGNIFHQGTRYPATVKAIPCLIELLRRVRQPDRPEILVLLNHLAVGYHESFLETGFDYTDRDVKKAWGRNAFGRSYVAVREGVDVYVDLLDDKDADVRCAAAFLLAFIGEAAAQTVPRIERRLSQERNAIAEGSMLIAAGMLTSVGKVSFDPKIFRKRISSAASAQNKKIVRCCAAMGLAYAAPQEVDASVMAVLQSATSDSQLAKTKSPWNNGDLASMAGILIGRVGKHSGEDVLPALLQALRSAKDGLAGLQAAETLIDHLFEPCESPHLRPSQIADRQSEASRAIHASDKAWHFGNMGWLMKAYALPDSRKLLGHFLGLTETGAASKSLKIKHEGKREEQPAWVWEQMMVDGLLPEQELAAAIAEQFIMADVVAFCVGPVQDMPSSLMRSRTQQRVRLCVAVFDRLGKRITAALTRHAKEILEADVWMNEARLSISVALTRIALAAKSEVPTIVDDLLQKALPASPAMHEELDYELAEEVLQALPKDRRFKLISSGDFPSGDFTGSFHRMMSSTMP